jgi:ADP-ribose pyrophosphatase
VSDIRRAGRRDIYKGRVFDVTVDRFADDAEGGREFDIEIVHHNGGAGILPVDDDGQVVLIRQWRYPLGRASIEVPAGRIEEGDDPEATARRELEEEAGLRASHVELLAAVYPAPGYTTEKVWIYLATGLEEVGQNLEEDERVEVLRMPLEEALAAVASGEIDDAKTIIALLRARDSSYPRRATKEHE